MIATSSFKRAGLLAGIVLVIAGLLAVVGVRQAAASDPVLCAAGRPCIDQLAVNNGVVTAHWKGDWDAYNVIWERIVDFRAQRLAPQFDVGGAHSHSFRVAEADQFTTIRVSVQGCDRTLFGSDCSPWTSREIVPALPYGPDTCKQGFVWREAFDGDHACVEPEARDQAAADNAEAAGRRSPNGGPYGPDTCLNGYVWREARPSDHVCVKPEIRTQTARDNQLANERRADPLASTSTP
jgi:hypothetical protein